MKISGTYFDGKSARSHAVELTVADGIATLSGDAERSCPISQLRVSERLRHAARTVTFPDGAYLEVAVADKATFDSLLHSTGHRESVVVRLQQSWRAALGAGAALIVAVVLGYIHVLPALSAMIARALPVSVERGIGREALLLLDREMFEPSQLPAQRRNAIIARFTGMKPGAEGAPDVKILFRKGRLAPNALALPSGEIILTDELVKLSSDDDALMGVLAHELGHLHERHLLRRLVQSSLVGATIAVLAGDLSSLVVALPTMLLHMEYSREAEREADDYAIAMLKANDVSLTPLVRLFEKMGAKEDNSLVYFRSHPLTSERIARILKAG